MESESIEASKQRTGPEITEALEHRRRAETRESERAVQLSETNRRREAVKSDPSRGENIDTFA